MEWNFYKNKVFSQIVFQYILFCVTDSSTHCPLDVSQQSENQPMWTAEEAREASTLEASTLEALTFNANHHSGGFENGSNVA